MIYISAQPFEKYFLWQLRIQLHNFQAMCIRKENIHVIFAIDSMSCSSEEIETFLSKNNSYAKFFTYSDIRESSKYTSSIRPNILKQHFVKFPELERETIFYHDSDILFTRIPQVIIDKNRQVCYVSDTRSYLDLAYIQRVGSEELLDDMLRIVGLDKKKIQQENQHTGGAQYIMQNITASFWEKVEKDSEELYILMKKYNNAIWQEEYEEKREFRSQARGIQAWCADMWAVLWNLWLFDKKVEIHPELQFSWPYSPIDEWGNKAIQHYSGNIRKKDLFFKKKEYLNYPPWYDEDLNKIPKTNCSYKIVECIQEIKKEMDANRLSFPDLCIVFDGRCYTEGLLDNSKILKTYLQKYVDIDVLILVDKLISQDYDKITSELLVKLPPKYKKILFIPLKFLPDVQDILDIIVKSYPVKELIFSPIALYNVDSLFILSFSKVLDIDLFHFNKGKFNLSDTKYEEFIRYLKLPNNTCLREEQLNNLCSSNYDKTMEIRKLQICFNLFANQ